MPNSHPDWTYEAVCTGLVCGVDEAGRGPLAGPVVAAAIILDPHKIPKGLNDSKALSHSRREFLLNEIQDTAVSIGIGIAEPVEIDRYNILQASLRAMARAIEDLGPLVDLALIDGNKAPHVSVLVKTIVKGDQKSLSIAAASIVAKVTRDRLMQEADRRFSGYGLAKHKGYPTQAHRDAVEQLGPCPVHRRSFQPVKAYYPAHMPESGVKI